MTHRNERAVPKTYTKQQRRTALSAVLSGEDAESVAERLDIHPGTLQVWVTDGRRGLGPCAEIYSDLVCRVSVDLSKLQVINVLHRHVHQEVERLRDNDVEGVREKLATALYELGAAENGVVTLSRQQADAVVTLLVDRVFDSPDPTADVQVGRLAIAALRLQRGG